MFDSSTFATLLDRYYDEKNINKLTLNDIVDATNVSLLPTIKNGTRSLKSSEVEKIAKEYNFKIDKVMYYCNDDNYTRKDIEQMSIEEFNNLIDDLSE